MLLVGIILQKPLPWGIAYFHVHSFLCSLDVGVGDPGFLLLLTCSVAVFLEVVLVGIMENSFLL